MPTNNPRITITLTPEVHALMRRVSELSGDSQSSLVAGMLAESAPVFERMVTVLEAAQKLKAQADDAPKEFAQGLEEAQRKLEAQLGLVFENMDTGFRPILEAAERIDRRSTRRSATVRKRAAHGDEPAQPPVSNRGVTPQSGTKRRASSTKPKGGR